MGKSKPNMLSLFNGMSVAEMAFEYNNTPVNTFYSEVDKHANKVTETLYPNATPLGDVRSVEVTKLPKINYLLGGSPCQSFSFAGKQNGMTTKSKEEVLTLAHYLQLKEDGFKFEGQSYLFWEYVRVLNEIKVANPSVVWLLENVVMVDKWRDVISGVLGVDPILIDSALVSGQQRRRYYWTNINNGIIPQPQEHNVDFHDLLEVSSCLNNKATIVGRRLNSSGKREDYNKSVAITQCIEVRKSKTNKTNCITTVKKDTILTSLSIGRHPDAFVKYTKDVDWRYLTAREALRLQTIPEEKIDIILSKVSENQAYKMAGNGWTMKVISHILNCSKNHLTHHYNVSQ